MGEKRVDRFIFKLADLLGEGSYGKVYKGYEDKVHTQVAIKTLSKSVINADEYLRDGLMSEIRVMQQLKSENVVQLIDVLETQNNYYIVQEYCDGGDFQHYLKKKGKLSQNEAVKFFVDILMGFMCLVKKGIIHRDVKPANILINKGVYKLADFGFAKTMDNFRNQMMTSAVGTPLYMSPQILKNEKYTTKSDVWSMGFIFYETICGKPPWNARSIPELIKNINTVPLTFPADLQIDIEYQNMIRGCLQMRESDRLNWDEIYSHKCFGRAFQFYIEGNKKMEDKALFLVNDLRLKVIHDNIDLELLFKQIDVSGDQQLDMHELGKLLHRIDKSLDREEIEYIFNKIDTDSSNSIDLSEFKKWLEDNNVRFTSKFQRNDQYHLSQNQINIEKPKIISEKVLPDNSPQYIPPPQMSQQSQSKQPQYVQQPSLRGSANMNMGDGSVPHPQQPYPPVGNPGIFPNGQQPPYQAPFQQPYSQPYNQQQFQPPVQPFGYQSNRGQGPNYPPYPQQVPGFQPSPQQVPGYQAPYQQPPYYQNAQWGTQSQMDRCNETIRKLVLAIEKYNINIWELFKKYDTSGGQSLDEAEFGIMLRRIDQKLSDQDIKAAFQLFDTDSSGQLTFSEFKEGLEYQIKQQQLRVKYFLIRIHSSSNSLRTKRSIVNNSNSNNNIIQITTKPIHTSNEQYIMNKQKSINSPGSDYQQLLFNQFKSEEADDLLLSSMSNESQLLFKSAESMKGSNKQKLYQPRAIQEESISQDSKQTSTLKSMESRELMLLQVNQQLRQQLSKLQSEAYCKELEFQQKLLQSQKDHENMMTLQKTKYEIMIQDLNAKLENITTQITQVNALFQQFQMDHQNCHINRPTTKKVQITETNLPLEVDLESQSGAFTARVESSNYMNQIANRSNPDEKLLFLYRREIDKIRQQTRNFEQKFEVEKNTIKQEIITLRNQKVQLQSIICKRANHSSEKKSGQSDNKTNRSKRESQSIRQYNHKSKQSFDF